MSGGELKRRDYEESRPVARQGVVFYWQYENHMDQGAIIAKGF